MSNPFESITNIFSRKSQSVVGIDIGSSSIKVIQLARKNNKAVLETYGEIALGPSAGLEIGRATNLPSQKIAEVLIDVLRESSVGSKLCGMAIPIASSLISLMEMPALDDKQLAQMIPIEARKYIPVPVQEVTLDWWVIPKEGDKSWNLENSKNEAVQRGRMVDVLLVAILNSALEKFQTVIRTSALDCSFFEIEVFSTIRSVLDRDIVPVMIVDIGAATTKLTIVERGIVKNSHIINRGSQDITLSISRALSISVADSENRKREFGLLGTTEEGKQMSEVALSVLQFIFTEANRTLLAYQKKYNKNVGKAVLTGGGSVLKGLFDVAKKTIETDVSLADPFSKVESPAFLEPVLKNAGPEFAVALGIALRRLGEVE